MDFDSGISFFNKHKAHLFVPFIGIGLSTYTRFSIYSPQPLPFAFLVAILSCLASALLIYTTVLLAAMIDDVSAKIFNIHFSWVIGASCLLLFVAKGAALYMLHPKQQEIQIADIESASRLFAVLLIGVMLMQITNSKAEKNRKKSEIRSSIKDKSKQEEPVSEHRS